MRQVQNADTSPGLYTSPELSATDDVDMSVVVYDAGLTNSILGQECFGVLMTWLGIAQQGEQVNTCYTNK